MELPADVTLHENFVTEEEARKLAEFCMQDGIYDDGEKEDYNQAYFGMSSGGRRPFIYRSKWPIHDIFWRMCERISQLEELGGYFPNMIMINRYKPGKGVPMHLDLKTKGFIAAVLTVQGKPCVMNFAKEKHLGDEHPDHLHALVKSRSLMVLKKLGLHCYQHGIDDHEPEPGEPVRISIQFRVGDMRMYNKRADTGEWSFPVEFVRGFVSAERYAELKSKEPNK